MSAESLVAIEAASKQYVTAGGLVDALPPTDARIAAGDVTAFVGISGSGKSTLLRLVAGHEVPSSGRVIVFGRDLATLSGPERNRFRRETVTYVSQRAADNLFPQLSLAEHLRAGSSLRPFEVLGIASRMRAHSGELSGGELARASFAVALAQGAPLVVVDEPTAELDRTTARRCTRRDGRRRLPRADVRGGDARPGGDRLANNVLDLTRQRPTETSRTSREWVPGEVALRLHELTKSYAGRRCAHRRFSRGGGRASSRWSSAARARASPRSSWWRGAGSIPTTGRSSPKRRRGVSSRTSRSASALSQS